MLQGGAAGASENIFKAAKPIALAKVLQGAGPEGESAQLVQHHWDSKSRQHCREQEED